MIVLFFFFNFLTKKTLLFDINSIINSMATCLYFKILALLKWSSFCCFYKQERGSYSTKKKEDHWDLQLEGDSAPPKL